VQGLEKEVKESHALFRRQGPTLGGKFGDEISHGEAPEDVHSLSL
jgi:hypothetical protein